MTSAAGHPDLPTSVSPPVSRPMRASDADRTATVLELQDAVARGCLTPDEGSERMALAFAAIFQNELPPLVADLPVADAGVSERFAGALVLARPADGDRIRLALLVLGSLLLLATAGSAVVHLFLDGGGGPFPGGHHRF